MRWHFQAITICTSQGGYGRLIWQGAFNAAPNVRFGPKADIPQLGSHVRFASSIFRLLARPRLIGRQLSYRVLPRRLVSRGNSINTGWCARCEQACRGHRWQLIPIRLNIRLSLRL